MLQNFQESIVSADWIQGLIFMVFKEHLQQRRMFEYLPQPEMSLQAVVKLRVWHVLAVSAQASGQVKSHVACGQVW